MKARALRKLAAGLIIASVALGNGQQEKRWVLLPESEVKFGKAWYSRQGPNRVTGTWQPTPAEIGDLENDLLQIRDLSKKSRLESQQIEHPERYFRQYLGIIQGQNRHIYLSAFCGVNEGLPPAYWRNRLFMILDGGNCVWQAVYDVKSSTFVELRVNGLG